MSSIMRRAVCWSGAAGRADIFATWSMFPVLTRMSWSTPEWRAAHIAIGGPTDRLPYADGYFDVVFTSEALLHTTPADLPGRLAEFVRICRGHILHIEAPPTWRGHSPSCGGCWGHDFAGAYASLG